VKAFSEAYGERLRSVNACASAETGLKDLGWAAPKAKFRRQIALLEVSTLYSQEEPVKAFSYDP
jgi:hypothetical protein